MVQVNQLVPLTQISGSISNNIAKLQFENDKRTLTSNLNKMMIKEVKRLDERESISITSQKYVLSFQSKLQMDDTAIDVSQLINDININFIEVSSFMKTKAGAFVSLKLDLDDVIANCSHNIWISGAPSLGYYHLE